MTVRLRIREISLEIESRDGPVGSRVSLGSGLNVIRADNSSGKSTVLQSIVYALGLEGMLSASREIPLPHSMTDHVEIEGQPVPVVSSSVRLEIENGAGAVITVRRYVVHPTIDRNLVQVWTGPAISESDGTFEQHDYFVRRPGAAQRDAGFHHYFSGWVGWTLPTVSRHDGGECPLYLECIFPFFYVEQKHGWSGVQARIPTYLGIRDVGKRSAEFVLGLQVFEQLLQRQRLAAAQTEIEAEWHEALAEYTSTVDRAGATVPDLPTQISSEIDPESARPKLFVDDEWLDTRIAFERLEERLVALRASALPTTGSQAPEVEAQLQEAQVRLDRTLGMLALVVEERREQAQQLANLDRRIDALDEDLRKHKDSELLESLGSTATAALADAQCPTCHQELGDGAQIATLAMTTAQSIAFIGQQLSTFKDMRTDTARVVDALRARGTTLEATSHALRNEIRALRDTLTAASSTPSIAAVTELVTLQTRIERFAAATTDIENGRSRIQRVWNQWRANRELRRALPISGLSAPDESQLATVERSFQRQLERYGFQSLTPSSVSISRETYRPAHEGFDLGFDISASDMIRVIWAYLLSVMSTGSVGGNHPGVLIFDEPRQQETAPASYMNLLHQASEASTTGTQMLIATSESRASLDEMMFGRTYTLIDVPTGHKLLRGPGS